MENAPKNRNIDAEVKIFVYVFAVLSGLMYAFAIDFTKYGMAFGILKGCITYTMGYAAILKCWEWLMVLTGDK